MTTSQLSSTLINLFTLQGPEESSWILSRPDLAGSKLYPLEKHISASLNDNKAQLYIHVFNHPNRTISGLIRALKYNDKAGGEKKHILISNIH